MDKLKHISLPVKMNFDESFENDKFLKLYLTFAHDGINPNKTRFSINDLTSHKDSLFLSPLLGNIIQNEDGDYAFGKHDMEFRPNPFKDNEMQVYYIENIIGIIPPEEQANFSTTVIDGRNYVTVTGYLYKGYSNFAEDIIKQYSQVPVSMEIDVYKYSFDAKAKVYDIQDFAYRGITFLNQECKTGMIGANAKVFSQSEDFYQAMFTIQQELKAMFASLPDECNKELYKEGGDILENNVINTENSSEIQDVENNSDTPTITENSDTNTESNENTPIIDSAEFNNTSSSVEDVNVIEEPVTPTKFTKSFELSHEDVRYGLYALLESVEETDNDWYYIDAVYDTYFDYSNCDMSKHYRQNYTKDGDNVVFVDERFEIFIERLTSTEKATLDMLRNNYEAEHSELEELRTFKANYDASVLKDKKDTILAKWEEFIGSGVEAFEQLKSDCLNYSIDELEVKCKCIFADVKAKVPATAFSATESERESNTYVNIPQAINNKEKTVNKPYGDLYEIFAK